MHSLAQVIVASEGKRQVAHTSADMSARQVLLYPSCSFYEVYGISVVLLHSGSHGQDVGVEYYVVGFHTGFFGK